MKKIFGAIAALALVAGFFSFGGADTAKAVDPAWDTTGNYVISFEYGGGNYPHDLNLTQDSSGNLDGTGGNPAGGTHTYTWDITSGAVSGNEIHFYANYTAPSDATSPLTTMHVMGTVGSDGTMSGTWTDNYQGGSRAGTWMTTSGTATSIDSEVDFTVTPWVYDPDQLGNSTAEWMVVGANPTYPTDKEACKKNGWKNASFQPAFKNQGQCVSYVDNTYGDGAEYHLFLEKDAATESNQAAGAEIEGEEGIVITSLGFDYMGSVAGSPRFNVYTESGVYYFFGCDYGTHTDLGNGWTRVTFANADAYPSDGTTVFPGFGSTTVTDIEIVMDEQGSVHLDNIMINGTTVGQE